MLFLDRDLVHHCLNGGELMHAAEGHEHRTRTDGRVKALGKSATRADVQISRKSLHAARKISGNCLGVITGLGKLDRGALGCTVGVEEFTGEVDDDLTVPGHGQSLFCLDASNARCFKVFLQRQLAEAIYVRGSHHHSHSFLAFADGKLGAVQTLVLFGNCVEINIQTVRQLTDGNRYAACTKVVASLDQLACLGIAEQSLQLSFLGCVTLLYLSTAAFQRLHGVRLGRAGCTAAAVATGSAAQQDDDVLGIGHLAAHVLGGSGCDDRADLHSLCRVAVVIQLVDHARGKTDLVAVRGITRSRRGDQLFLGQLAGQGFGQRARGICAARYTHCCVYVRASRQRVTDRTANAGCRAAKGLNFGGVIVRLVLKEQQPGLVALLGLDRDLDRASVDLLGFVNARQLAVCL